MRPDGQIPKWQCGIIKMEIVLKDSLHFLNHFLQSGTFPFYKCSFKNKVLRDWFLIGGGINFFNGHKRSLFPHFMRRNFKRGHGCFQHSSDRMSGQADQTDIFRNQHRLFLDRPQSSDSLNIYGCDDRIQVKVVGQ